MPPSMMKEVPAVLFWDFRTSVSKQIEHFTSLRSFLRFTINWLPYSFPFVHTFTHTVSTMEHILLGVQETALHSGTDILIDTTWSLLSLSVTTWLSPDPPPDHVQNVSFSSHQLSYELWRLATLAWCRSAPLRGSSLPKPKPNNKVMTKMNLIPKIRRCSLVAFLRSSVFFL